jgi:hypothetical protein
MQSPVTRLRLTPLEDRTVPSTVALCDPWPDPGALTLSFAPDSARIGNANSALFNTFNRIARTDQWETEILRAFQSWVAVSNLNIGLVDDSGAAFGTPGAVQGDTRFGDIRIGARALSTDTVASAVPFEWSAGTWSGDVVFNTAAKFGINPTQTGTYDLFTVAVHEAGHALGLDHTDDPNSVMTETYTSAKTGLSALDIVSVQSIYGARQADQYEGATGNNSFATAIVLTGTGNQSVTADLTTTGDVDYYRFVTSATADALTVRLQTSGISLLTAKVTVLDAAGNVVGAALSTDPLNGDLQVKIDHPNLNSAYTVRVEAARTDVFGIGRYTLSVVYADTSTTNFDPNDHGTNDTPGTATVLFADSNYGSVGGTGAVTSGRLESRTDVDYYRVTAPTDGGPVMVVEVSGTTAQRLPSAVGVYDANMNLLPARVSSDGSKLTLEVAHVVRGQDYFVRVSGGANTTNEAYLLRVSFTDIADDDLTELMAGGLGGSTTTATGKLSLASSTLFQFALDSATIDGTGGATVTLTVTDSKGRPVAQLAQAAGTGSVLLTVYLSPGDYTLTVNLSLPKGSVVSGVNYRLAGGIFSIPIGPYETTTGTTPGTTGTGTTTLAPTPLPPPPAPGPAPLLPTDPTPVVGIYFTFTPLNVYPISVMPYSF